jgi:hypothetical protein
MTMSTHALIYIDQLQKVVIYKHWDGDGLMNWLQKFNTDFTANRGDDPSYKAAQLLRASVRDEATEEMRDCLDESRYTGWGIVENHFEQSADYHYFLRSKGKVDRIKDGEAIISFNATSETWELIS